MPALIILYFICHTHYVGLFSSFGKNVCFLTLNHRTFRLEETIEIFQFGEFSNFPWLTSLRSHGEGPGALPSPIHPLTTWVSFYLSYILTFWVRFHMKNEGQYFKI